MTFIFSADDIQKAGGVSHVPVDLTLGTPQILTSQGYPRDYGPDAEQRAVFTASSVWE